MLLLGIGVPPFFILRLIEEVVRMTMVTEMVGETASLPEVMVMVLLTEIVEEV
jgi:hypothetical protein